MASRLSEDSLRAVLDAGQQGLAIQSDRSLDAAVAAGVDLDALLLAAEPQAAVQAVPPQAMYAALLRRGPEDCLEILPLLSAEQVTRIFDYDVWDKDQLEPRKVARWLNLFKEVGNEEMYRRFRDLDEEYQVGLMAPLVELLTEEDYEKLPQPEQDALHRLPCGTLYYRLKTQDPRLEEFVESLVEASLGSDVAYAYSLLAHASYMPPNESEALLAQFRRARLEEDGFVTYEESLAAFRPIDLEALRRVWPLARPGDADGLPAASASDARLFLQRVLEDQSRDSTPDQQEVVTRGLAFLANSLCAATQVATDDVGGLGRLLRQAQAAVSLGLEWLAGGDVRMGRVILTTEHPQQLFRTGLTLVRGLIEALLQRFASHGLPGIEAMRRQLALDKRGLLGLSIERELTPILGFERVETLKGLCNRLPVRPVSVDEDEHGALHVTFRPVASLADLTVLAELADGLTGLLYVGELADGDAEAAKTPLDRRLTTALARVLVGGRFRSEPLAADERARLAALPREAAEAMASDIFTGVEESLRQGLASAGGGWAASRAAGVDVRDPVQPVMNELAELVFRLRVALEHARASGSPLPDFFLSTSEDP